MRLVVLLLVAVLASSCATHRPPPVPSGRFRPVNGIEQDGMTSPGENQSHPCPASNPKSIC